MQMFIFVPNTTKLWDYKKYKEILGRGFLGKQLQRRNQLKAKSNSVSATRLSKQTN